MLTLLARMIEYIAARPQELLTATGEHLRYVAVALSVAMALCIPLGVWTSHAPWRRVAQALINAFSGIRVIPSLAVLFLALPYFGLSFASSAIALTILALPPILVNTDAAFRAIDVAIIEAARGMGMTPRQTLLRVELPLALPVMLAGIRTATVEVIASATLAAFIGGGGLGLYITRGFAMYDNAILLTGAIPVALLAFGAELLFGGLQRWVSPPDMRTHRSSRRSPATEVCHP
ncbi:MAG: ABC transporter permease [Anaerolineae bacterium]|nr:ABC transporter permease [Anaerolineae bacterium]